MVMSSPARIVATVLVVAAAATSASPARAQSISDVKLGEAKQLAGAVLRALQQCVQRKGPGASCTLAEVASAAGVNPGTGASGDGRWVVGPSSTLTLSSGAPPVTTGAITVAGTTRDTAGLATSLYVMPSGSKFRCETRSGAPPGPDGGAPC